MENKSHALAAGIFVLALTVLLLVMSVWLMRDNTASREFEISTAQSVTGLQPQAGVRFKGVPVGRVTAIGLDPQVQGNVLVRISLNAEVPVSRTTVASLGFQGVTGLAFIQLEDTGVQSPALATTGTQPGRIPMRPGMLARWTEEGDQLLAELNQAGAHINDLLAAQNQQQLMQTVSNLGQAAASLQHLTQRVDQAMLGRPGDPALDLPRLANQVQASFKSMQATADLLRESAESVRTSAAEFKKVLVRMNEPDGTLDRIARNTDAMGAGGRALTNSLLPRLNRVADDAARTVRRIEDVADTVAEHPQALLLGAGAATPGPGEPGFVAPPAK